MKIGVDMRVLQVGHQFRGIGEVAKRTLNEIFIHAVADPSGVELVFYEYDDEVDPRSFVTIPPDLRYEVVKLGPRPLLIQNRSMGDKLRYKWQVLFGNPLPAAHSCDVLLQFDYGLGVPRHPRTVLVKHDIIPYIFWSDYFTSPWLHVKHRAARTTLRTLIHNYEYKRVLRRSVRNAWRIICVSEHTKKDLHRYLRVPLKKMQTIHLGVSEARLPNETANKSVLPTKPYLLFIGAVDARRRAIDDIVAAYNNLRADGSDLQLVLAGENFQAPEKIPNQVVRDAVMKSSYREDILTLGYIDDATKYQLYTDALAFVFPTTYEGFGIPVLEAMLLGCPVIVYKNSSIPEVGGKHVLYAKDWQTIWQQVLSLQSLSAMERQQLIDGARKHAQGFTWQKTGRAVYEQLRAHK